MNTLDTIPAAAAQSGDSLTTQLSDWYATITDLMTKVAHSPPAIALFVNIGLLQVIEGLDRFLPDKFHVEGTKELDHRIRFGMAWLGTILVMPAVCWMGKLDFRGDNALLACLAGPFAALLNSYVLKKVGIDLDKWASATGAAPPLPPAD